MMTKHDTTADTTTMMNRRNTAAFMITTANHSSQAGTNINNFRSRQQNHSPLQKPQF